uniref:Uncharacterized protein n=1 Tax=Solanum tuberosum TaxID=4113 RepID=M1BEL5_SOLTU
MHCGKKIHALQEKEVMHRRKSCIAEEKIHASREKIHASREKRLMHSKKKKPCIARKNVMRHGKEINAL